MQYDTLFISRPENVRYLSGFTGEGVLLLKYPTQPPLPKGRSKRILITDPRYELRVKEEKKSGVQVVVVDKSFAEALTAALKTLRTKSLGFEASHLTVAGWAKLKRQVRQLDLRFVATEGVIESERAVKSAAEIQKLKKACQITVRVLRGVLRFLKIGKTELAVAEEIRRLAIWLGAEGLAFDSVVAFGANSACPHAKPGRRKLRKGELVLLDLGVKYAGYCADMTRTFFTAPPSKIQKQVYEAVRTAQLAGVQKVQAGVEAHEVDAVVRGVLANPSQAVSLVGRSALVKGGRKEDFSKQFTHGTGHGVGLEIHEAPHLSAKSKDLLRTGQVVTVEPGVYLSGEFGVRIEDTVVVGVSGAEILTEFPKGLMVLKV